MKKVVVEISLQDLKLLAEEVGDDYCLRYDAEMRELAESLGDKISEVLRGTVLIPEISEFCKLVEDEDDYEILNYFWILLNTIKD